MPSNPASIQPLLFQLDELCSAYEKSGLFGNGGNRQQSWSGGAQLRRRLQLVRALLRNVLGAAGGTHQHVCVFGGTQVGKSTVINILAQQPVAKVYHTAGFTRHAQAFGPGTNCDALKQQFPYAFPGFDCVAPEELQRDKTRQLSTQAAGPFPIDGSVVLWDAPDADAVEAETYQQGLIEALALSDVVVYVSSREKYAVNHLLEWVAELQDTGAALVAVLNMAPVAQQAELLQSMQQALQEVRTRRGGDTVPPLRAVALEYMTAGAADLHASRADGPQALRAVVAKALTESVANRDQRKRAAVAYLQQTLPLLLVPARSILDAREEWEKATASATHRFAEDYRIGYLDDPQRYDAFNQVGIEILKLLNPPVPGLQKALMTVRTLLSLPARAIIFGSKALWRFAQKQSGMQRSAVPNEIVTYQEAHARLLNTMAGELAKKQMNAQGEAAAFWLALGAQYTQRIATVQQEFDSKLAAHRTRTDEWVRQTAQGIYGELAKDPVKLNLLRTGRIAADAGAILVAVHTGGQGNILHDLIVTPAVMSVVEAISQQVAGTYVEGRRRELRERLLEDTRAFADDVYATRLRDLADAALAHTGFSQVSPELLASIPAELERLNASLSNEART